MASSSTQRTLTTAIPAELFEKYRASLPEGSTVNSHLRGLVEAWIAGVEYGQREAPVLVMAGGDLQPTPVPVWEDPVVIDGGTNFGDPGCMHPRHARYRSDRSVLCSMCGKVL